MALTQAELARQMLAQLKVLDPAISAEVGTPERKLVDTVAQSLADVQIDLDVLSGALDLDTRFGQNLDRFLAMFGFARQQATRAQGFVEFTRESPALNDITIPAGTQVVSPTNGAFYITTIQVVLRATTTSQIAPVQAATAGSFSNISPGDLGFTGAVVFGVTGVTNPVPISGGQDAESDDEYKIRFKNTVFRNLAGTESQYLALAASSAFTTKANVVGPLSRYREYIEVPQVADNAVYDINNDGADEPGNGLANEYTSAISTVPNSKHVYTETPYFVSNGKAGANTLFFRDGIDFRLNVTDKNHGDAYRLWNPQGSYYADPTHLASWRESVPDPANSPYQPNLTFINVYTGADPTVQAVRPQDVVLFEHSYMSTASRNDFDHNVTNCVDVFIDGGNNVTASTILPAPGSGSQHLFRNDATSKYHAPNYRRAGESTTQPTLGNLFLPLFWQPVTSLPDSLVITGTVGVATYYLGINYWLVEDVSGNFGTVRARNGIEWKMTGRGFKNGDNPDTPGAWTGPLLSEFDSSTTLEIRDYGYDRNIVDLQTAFEGAKQVTTDALVHKARRRYFKLDITVMYIQGVATTEVNAAIRTSVEDFFARQYFGTAIQLSDVLQVIHNTPGVDNVRWSSDVPTSQDLDRLVETNRDGTVITDLQNDFFLNDDELPGLAENTIAGDTLPGLIIRSRAQNTWVKAKPGV